MKINPLVLEKKNQRELLRTQAHEARHNLNSLGHGHQDFISAKARKHLHAAVDSYYLFLNELKRMGIDLGDYS